MKRTPFSSRTQLANSHLLPSHAGVDWRREKGENPLDGRRFLGHKTRPNYYTYDFMNLPLFILPNYLSTYVLISYFVLIVLSLHLKCITLLPIINILKFLSEIQTFKNMIFPPFFVLRNTVRSNCVRKLYANLRLSLT